MKRTLLFVVDGCTSRVLGPEIDQGRLPVLAQLAARGSLRLDCVSIFPSITPAATSSIVTGRYPAGHGIGGMSWWDPETSAIDYFGDDIWTIVQRGMDDFLQGFLVRLNGERLSAPTLFQLVERHGMRAACFNYLIFRGDVPHTISAPLLLRILPFISSKVEVHGPSWLCLGDFISKAGRHDVEASGGPLNRFGLDDQGTESFLRDVPDASALPEFSVAYFADYDYNSHEEGPAGARETLLRLDRRLGHIFDDWGGIDRVLDDTCIMLTADHSHSDVGNDDTTAIVLDDVLHGYRCADPSSGWKDGDQLLLCPNMRAAEVYLRGTTPEALRDVCRILLEEPRIDQVIWRESREDGDEFHVATRDRGAVQFRPVSAGANTVRDEYGGHWSIRGEPLALDMRVADGEIRYGEYPNALERLANDLDDPRAGRVWATARPGYEFRIPGQSVHHRGGSHGTLHALDSIVPLLICGAPDRPPLQTTPRIVDVTPLCAEVLGMPFEPRPGTAHR